MRLKFSEETHFSILSSLGFILKGFPPHDIWDSTIFLFVHICSYLMAENLKLAPIDGNIRVGTSPPLRPHLGVYGHLYRVH